MIFLLAIISIIAYSVYRVWKISQYWEERGVPYVKSYPFLGNSLQQLFKNKSLSECFNEICRQYPDEPYVGYFEFLKPVLIVKDISLVEKILIKDFTHFIDHGINLEVENFDSNLFLMNGKKWKAVRNKMSPVFTSGKLKMMFDSMKECGDQLVIQLGKERYQEIDLKDLISRFAMDIIGSCAFGIDAGALSTEDSEFCRMAKKTFEMDYFQFIKFVIVTTLPKLAKLFKISLNKADVKAYFCGVINETLKHRRINGYKRNDLVQLLMQLQRKGYVEIQVKNPADAYLDTEEISSTEKFELTDEELTGHAFTFLGAGFESTNITIRYALYELSKHPEMQEKAREEVLREVKRTGEMTYETIKEMSYLENCVKETLRKYAPTQGLIRGCNKEYTFPQGLTIPSNMKILIPMDMIHYNPEIYPEPDKFQPERFDQLSLPACAFIPFGQGPRICIAMRFALLEMKYCLAKLLMNFSFKINPKTKEPLTEKPRSLFRVPNEDIIFNVNKIS